MYKTGGVLPYVWTSPLMLLSHSMVGVRGLFNHVMLYFYSTAVSMYGSAYVSTQHNLYALSVCIHACMYVSRNSVFIVRASLYDRLINQCYQQLYRVFSFTVNCMLVLTFTVVL